jgi:transcriptional regulator with XRE-family HTH domain
MKYCFLKSWCEHKRDLIVSDSAIGTLMRQRRHELGLTLEELASHLGVTCQQVQRYECGKNRLNVENIQGISEALNVPVSYFFTPVHPQVVGELCSSQLDATEQILLERFRRVSNGVVREMVVRIVGIVAGNVDANEIQHIA